MLYCLACTVIYINITIFSSVDPILDTKSTRLNKNLTSSTFVLSIKRITELKFVYHLNAIIIAIKSHTLTTIAIKCINERSLPHHRSNEVSRDTFQSGFINVIATPLITIFLNSSIVHASELLLWAVTALTELAKRPLEKRPLHVNEIGLLISVCYSN